MAILIPSRPGASLSRGATRLYPALKTLPDTWTVRLRMRPEGCDDGPDFLLLHEGTLRAFLVRSLRQSKAQILSGGSLDTDASGLKGFVADQTFSAGTPLVLFHHELETLPQAPEGVAFLGASALKEIDLESRLLALGAIPLLRGWWDELLRSFAPESMIEPTHLMHDLFEAHEAPVAPLPRPAFLDLHQEHLTKRDLELSEEARRTVGDFQVRLITGVAGGGKTLILLHRAALLAKLFPKARILILTFNKALNSELQRRLQVIAPGSPIHCHSFYSWCGNSWKSQGRRTRISVFDKHAHIRDLAFGAFGAESPLVPHLEHELDWIHLSGFKEWEEYRNADRKGQGFRLTQAQREAIWEICLRWRTYLDRNSLGDFPHFSWRFLHALREGLEPTGTWDHILIDEAQFFSPTWYEILRKHIKPQGSLFLCADPSQGFLRHGLSWHAAGLEVRGRTDRIEKSYRTTRQILSMAWRFLSSHAVLEAEAVVPNTSAMKEGPHPEFLEAADLEGEVRKAAVSIGEHLQRGLTAGMILVLVAEGERRKFVRERLQKLTGAPVHFAEEPRSDAIRVCGLDAATGLEAPIVYVLGASHLLEAEGNPTLTEEERQELRDHNGRRLYMGFTRAGSQLFVGWSGKVPEELKAA